MARILHWLCLSICLSVCISLCMLSVSERIFMKPNFCTFCKKTATPCEFVFRFYNVNDHFTRTSRRTCRYARIRFRIPDLHMRMRLRVPEHSKLGKQYEASYILNFVCQEKISCFRQWRYNQNMNYAAIVALLLGYLQN